MFNFKEIIETNRKKQQELKALRDKGLLIQTGKVKDNEHNNPRLMTNLNELQRLQEGILSKSDASFTFRMKTEGTLVEFTPDFLSLSVKITFLQKKGVEYVKVMEFSIPINSGTIAIHDRLKSLL